MDKVSEVTAAPVPHQNQVLPKTRFMCRKKQYVKFLSANDILKHHSPWPFHNIVLGVPADNENLVVCFCLLCHSLAHGLSTNWVATLHKPKKNTYPPNTNCFQVPLRPTFFFSRTKTCLHWLRCVLLLSNGHLRLKNLFNYWVVIIASRHVDYVHFCHWT